MKIEEIQVERVYVYERMTSGGIDKARCWSSRNCERSTDGG